MVGTSIAAVIGAQLVRSHQLVVACRAQDHIFRGRRAIVNKGIVGNRTCDVLTVLVWLIRSEVSMTVDR